MKPKSDTTPALYIGLDVHKENTSVAVADPGPDGVDIRSHGEKDTEEQLQPPPSAGNLRSQAIRARKSFILNPKIKTHPV